MNKFGRDRQGLFIQQMKNEKSRDFGDLKFRIFVFHQLFRFSDTKIRKLQKKITSFEMNLRVCSIPIS